MAGKEKLFEQRIKTWLQKHGIYAVGTPKQKMTVTPIGYYEKRWGSKMTVSGLPDLHISVNGYDFELELKAPNGHASMLQKHMIEQMQNSYAYIVYEFAENIPKDGYNYYATWDYVQEVILHASKLQQNTDIC